MHEWMHGQDACLVCPAAVHAFMHAVTLELAAAFDDVYSVQLWAPSNSSFDEMLDYVAVWLSPTANFTAGTPCAQSVCLLEGSADTASAPATVLCPPASGTKYVTVARAPLVATAAEQMALDEVRILRRGKAGACLTGSWAGSEAGRDTDHMQVS